MNTRAKLYHDYIHQIDPNTFEQFVDSVNENQDLFDQYLEGKLSTNEKAQFEAQLAEDEALQFAFQLHKSLRSGVESLAFRQKAETQMSGIQALVLEQQDQRFEAYCLDKMPEAERMAFEKELETNTLLALELQEFEQKWQHTHHHSNLAPIVIAEKQNGKSDKVHTLTSNWKRYLSVAAILGLFVLGAFFITQQLDHATSYQTIVAVHYEVPNPKAVTWTQQGVKAGALQTPKQIEVLREEVKTQLEQTPQDHLKTILVIQDYLNQVQPQNEDYYLYVFMGNAYWQLEKYEDAMSCFKMAMNNIDEGQTGWKQDAQKYLALAYLQTNETDKALKLLADLKDHAVGGKMVKREFEELYQAVLGNQ